MLHFFNEKYNRNSIKEAEIDYNFKTICLQLHNTDILLLVHLCKYTEQVKK